MSPLSLIGAMKDALGFYAGRAPFRLTAYVLVVCGVLIFVTIFLLPPAGFPKGALVEIPENASFGETAILLKEQNIITSSFFLRALARVSGADRKIDAGRYLFEEPENLISILIRLAKGEHGLPSTRVTFPEGISVRQMGSILKNSLAGFDENAWLAKAGPFEGYLFPDTYNFYKDAPIDEVIARMQDNFEERTEELKAETEALGVSWSGIVIMASLIEKEANTEEDRHIVSGILWSRIEEGVALQVDAVFPYIRENPDHIPNGDDPDIESPYNTYLNRGLPPGPIANPGLEALDSALHPTATDYFYYLTGNDGNMYYAESFEGHKRNRELYLD